MDFRNRGRFPSLGMIVENTGVNAESLAQLLELLFASGEIRQIASVEKRQFGSAEIRQFESIEKSQS